MSSPRAITETTLLTKEHTLGGGDCAFNAFVLGLCQQDVLFGLEDRINAANPSQAERALFEKFIIDAKNALNIPTTSSLADLQKKILELRKTPAGKIEPFKLKMGTPAGKIELQIKLQPIMRQLAIDLIEGDQNRHTQTEDLIKDALRGHILANLKPPVKGPKDDIFSGQGDRGHQFIRDKFNEIYNKHRKELIKKDANKDTIITGAQEELGQWWESEGHKKFLTAMRKQNRWAGDLELAPLAAFFKVNLVAIAPSTGNKPTHLHFDCGSLPITDASNKPILTPDQIKQLKDRGIVDQEQNVDGSLRLLPLADDEVKRRLGAVDDYTKVKSWLENTNKTSNESIEDDIKDFSPACKKELITRGIINSRNTPNKHLSDIDNKKDALARIAEISNIDDVINLYNENKRTLPTITLHNSGGHWSNMVVADAAPKVEPKKTARQAPAQRTIEIVTRNEEILDNEGNLFSDINSAREAALININTPVAENSSSILNSGSTDVETVKATDKDQDITVIKMTVEDKGIPFTAATIRAITKDESAGEPNKITKVTTETFFPKKLPTNSNIMELVAQSVKNHQAGLSKEMINEPIKLSGGCSPEVIKAYILYCEFKGIALTPPNKKEYLDFQKEIDVRKRSFFGRSTSYLDVFTKTWKESHPDDIGIREQRKLELKTPIKLPITPTPGPSN